MCSQNAPIMQSVLDSWIHVFINPSCSLNADRSQNPGEAGEVCRCSGERGVLWGGGSGEVCVHRHSETLVSAEGRTGAHHLRGGQGYGLGRRLFVSGLIALICWMFLIMCVSVAEQILRLAKCSVACNKAKMDVKPYALSLDPSVKFEVERFKKIFLIYCVQSSVNLQ